MKRFLALLAPFAIGCSAPAEPIAEQALLTEPVDVLVLLDVVQQSNGTGTDQHDAPSGLPDPSIPFWVNDFYYHDGPLRFEPLNVRVSHHGYFSHEIRTAQALKEAGRHVAVIKLTKGATYLSRWLPGKAMGDLALAELAQAWAALPAQFPEGSVFHPIWIVDQGEEEARYFDQPSVERWSGYFRKIQTAVEGVVGEPLSPYVVRTSSLIRGKTFPGVLEAQQAAVAGHLFTTEDLEVQSDGVHRTGRAQNILGDRIAAEILQ